jgi:hypothetical protein
MTISDTPLLRQGEARAFLLALIANTIWINLSEVFRYFAFVMPMMRSTLSMVSDVAPMDVPVFLIWGAWDTILVAAATGFSWLLLERFGNSIRVVFAAGSAIWATVFVILWVGLWNMNLAKPAILAVALPLAWIEMVVAAFIVRWARKRSTVD